MSPTPQEKYRARIDELESLKVELEVQKRPGDPAPIIGRVLEAAGDLLRRKKVIAADLKLVQAVLALVPEAPLKSWADGVVVADIKTRLARAASQAVEVALPDSPEDGATFATWVMQDLQIRDRFESALVALHALAEKGRGDARVLGERLRRAITEVDAAQRRGVTALTALNAERRTEANLLDADCRAAAWWFSERCGPEDDLLVKVLGGEAKGTLGIAEKSAHQTVGKKRSRKVTYDELFRFDLGLASPAEAAAIRTQAERDGELKKTLAALDAGERAIEELTRDEQPAARIAPVPVELRTSSAPEVIDERDEFKVLVFRSKARVQVVVQPRRKDRFAAAAVHLTDDPQRSVPSQPGDMGLHFELGPSERLAGKTARVVVKLTDGQTIATEVKL